MKVSCSMYQQLDMVFMCTRSCLNDSNSSVLSANSRYEVVSKHRLLDSFVKNSVVRSWGGIDFRERIAKTFLSSKSQYTC